MPIKILHKILFTILCFTSLANLNTNITIKTVLKTQNKILAPEELLNNFNTANIELTRVCIEFDNYPTINSILEKIEIEINDHFTKKKIIKPIHSLQIKAKIYQLATAIAENYSSKNVLQLGNYYLAVATIFEWQQSDWKKILNKYRNVCFTNYIKNSLEGPFINTTKILGCILLLVKFVAFIKNPSKTLINKEKETNKNSNTQTHQQDMNLPLRNGLIFLGILQKK